MHSLPWDDEYYNILSQCIRYYVLFLKVRRAYQSEIDSYLSTVNTIYYNGQSYTISRTESGPATTLVVKQGGDVCVTVDVVACVNGRVLTPRARFVHSGSSKSILFKKQSIVTPQKSMGTEVKKWRSRALLAFIYCDVQTCRIDIPHVCIITG